jgi:hypothetical protein
MSYFLYSIDFISIDFRLDKLIVRFPSIGHEIMSNLFHVMAKSGTGYPERYGSSTIIEGGSADIHHHSGYKSPDFSLYEVNDNNPSKILDSTTPTIVFEVAYTQPTRSVVLEAARHICLTRGEVQLVVAIDIVHKANTKPRELKSVTWSHWEEDVLSYREVESGEQGEVDDIRPEAPDGGNEEEDEDGVDDEGGSDGENDGDENESKDEEDANDEEEFDDGADDEGGGNDEGDEEVVDWNEYVVPPPMAYTAVVSQPGDQKRYRMRAEQTAKWQVSDPTLPSYIISSLNSFIAIPRC